MGKSFISRLVRFIRKMMSKQKTFIAFLPWIKLPKKVKIGPISFIPFEAPSTDGSERSDGFSQIMKKVLSSYKDIEGKERKSSTVIKLEDREPSWQLKDGDEEKVLLASRILTVSAFAKNKYFHQLSSYTNASAFMPTFQRIRTNQIKHISFKIRKRDGYILDGGYEHGKVNIAVPLECRILKDIDIDCDLAMAIWNAYTDGHVVAERIISSLPFFCLANTDSELMDQDAEIILMGSALEQVFGIEESSKAYCLSCKLHNLLEDYGSVQVEEAKKGYRPNIELDKKWKDQQSKWYLHQKWIHEFYQLRNEYVHVTKNRSKWGWSPFEHLLMAAFVFPLIVKLLLSEKGCYKLKNEDKRRCDAIDKILAANDWGNNWNNAQAELSERAKNEIIQKVNEEMKNR